MTVAEETKTTIQAVEREEKIWRGPSVGDVDGLVGEWPSLGHYFFHKLGTDHKDRVLFTDFESGRTWTGGQLKAKITNVACALVDKYNFKPKTVVCISYDNSDYLFILACAVISAGGTVACAYSLDPYAELLYLMRKVEGTFLFCHQKNIGWAKQLSEDMGYPVTGIIMDKQTLGDSEESPKSWNNFENLLWYDSKKSKSSESIPVACKDKKRHVTVITMSSGTSGKPKAVAQTHWNALAELVAGGRRNAPPDFTFVCSASLDYVSGRLILFGAIHSGYRVIILNGFEPRTMLEACERYQVNVIYIGAASFYNLITYKHLKHYDLSSVKCVFPMGAKIIYLKELASFFEQQPNIVQVRQGYGASEFCGGAMNSMTPSEYLRDCENCGHLLPGTRAKIVCPTTGKSLGPNEEGILHIAGETVFPGYYDREHTRQRRAAIAKQRLADFKLNNNNSDLPEDEDELPLINHAEIFDSQGFYITGDYAHFNDKEELYIRGRQKELMSCRGAKKVLPQELEVVLSEHPAVHKVCVLGIPSERTALLQCPRAFVVPKESYYNELCPDEHLELSQRLSTLNRELEQEMSQEPLVHKGNRAHELNKRMKPSRRHLIVEDLMQFVNERVGWEKQLTGGIVLLDDIPISRATGKFDKNYLRSLTLDRVEIYGDLSTS